MGSDMVELNDTMKMVNSKLQDAIQDLYRQVADEYGPGVLPFLRPVIEMPGLHWNDWNDKTPQTVTVKLVFNPNPLTVTPWSIQLAGGRG